MSGPSRQYFEGIEPIGSKGLVVWFTGLSGSGKSTLAAALCYRLSLLGQTFSLIDGDVIRRSLSSDLTFSRDDRRENIRRVGAEVEKVVNIGQICVTALISPYREDRGRIRHQIGESRFIEVFVNTPIEVCEKRDPKGLYKKARAGLISHFTGISDPYEAPLRPEVEVRTDESTVDECVDQIFRACLKARDGLAIRRVVCA